MKENDRKKIEEDCELTRSIIRKYLSNAYKENRLEDIKYWISKLHENTRLRVDANDR